MKFATALATVLPLAAAQQWGAPPPSTFPPTQDVCTLPPMDCDYNFSHVYGKHGCQYKPEDEVCVLLMKVYRWGCAAPPRPQPRPYPQPVPFRQGPPTTGPPSEWTPTPGTQPPPPSGAPWPTLRKRDAAPAPPAKPCELGHHECWLVRRWESRSYKHGKYHDRMEEFFWGTVEDTYCPPPKSD